MGNGRGEWGEGAQGVVSFSRKARLQSSARYPASSAPLNIFEFEGTLLRRLDATTRRDNAQRLFDLKRLGYGLQLKRLLNADEGGAEGT